MVFNNCFNDNENVSIGLTHRTPQTRGATKMSLTIRKLTKHIGAEVEGLDFSNGIDPQSAKELSDTLTVTRFVRFGLGE